MEKRTEREPFEDRPEEVKKRATGQVSDGTKLIWVSQLPLRSIHFLSFSAGTMRSINVKNLLDGSCKVILLFSLTYEASRNRNVHL